MICIKLSPAQAALPHWLPRIWGYARRLRAPAPSLSLRAVWVIAGLLGLGAVQGAQAQSGPQPRLPTIELQAGIHVIKTELAITPEQQSTGMMHRREMGTNDGMLFVNEEPGLRCFWMRNTLVPLTIAFLADDGTIVNTADMEPLSEKSHCAAKPVRYALEMNRGWFAKRGLKAGSRITGKPFSR